MELTFNMVCPECYKTETFKIEVTDRPEGFYPQLTPRALCPKCGIVMIPVETPLLHSVTTLLKHGYNLYEYGMQSRYEYSDKSSLDPKLVNGPYIVIRKYTGDDSKLHMSIKKGDTLLMAPKGTARAIKDGKLKYCFDKPKRLKPTHTLCVMVQYDPGFENGPKLAASLLDEYVKAMTKTPNPNRKSITASQFVHDSLYGDLTWSSGWQKCYTNTDREAETNVNTDA